MIETTGASPAINEASGLVTGPLGTEAGDWPLVCLLGRRVDHPNDRRSFVPYHRPSMSTERAVPAVRPPVHHRPREGSGPRRPRFRLADDRRADPDVRGPVRRVHRSAPRPRPELRDGRAPPRPRGAGRGRGRRGHRPDLDVRGQRGGRRLSRRAKPVLVDVDAATLNATPEAIRAAVTPRTKAVVVVHVGGRPMEIERLVEALDGTGVAIVEDAAHAFPSRVGGPDGRFAGRFGAVGAYSFYATKTITTGEGGMLVTDDDAIADRARLMSPPRDQPERLEPLHRGWLLVLRDRGRRLQVQPDGPRRGARDRPAGAGRGAARGPPRARSRIHGAAVGVVGRRPRRASRRRARRLARLAPVHHPARARPARDRPGGRDRGAEGRGIGTSVHFIPLHLHPYYRDRWGYRPADLPVAAREYERVVSLPIWPGMTDGDLDRVDRRARERPRARASLAPARPSPRCAAGHARSSSTCRTTPCCGRAS